VLGPRGSVPFRVSRRLKLPQEAELPIHHNPRVGGSSPSSRTVKGPVTAGLIESSRVVRKRVSPGSAVELARDAGGIRWSVNNIREPAADALAAAGRRGDASRLVVGDTESR
jgi:hypothetical protein